MFGLLQFHPLKIDQPVVSTNFKTLSEETKAKQIFNYYIRIFNKFLTATAAVGKDIETVSKFGVLIYQTLASMSDVIRLQMQKLKQRLAMLTMKEKRTFLLALWSYHGMKTETSSYLSTYTLFAYLLKTAFFKS